MARVQTRNAIVRQVKWTYHNNQGCLTTPIGMYCGWEDICKRVVYDWDEQIASWRCVQPWHSGLGVYDISWKLNLTQFRRPLTMNSWHWVIDVKDPWIHWCLLMMAFPDCTYDHLANFNDCRASTFQTCGTWLMQCWFSLSSCSKSRAKRKQWSIYVALVPLWSRYRKLSSLWKVQTWAEPFETSWGHWQRNVEETLLCSSVRHFRGVL